MSEEKLQKALNLLSKLIDPDNCWFDHEGYCQAHYLENPCSVKQAKDFLDECGIKWKDES